MEHFYHKFFPQPKVIVAKKSGGVINATKVWQGEKNPRGQFNNSFAMYKIYVMQDVSNKRADAKKESDHLSIINVLMP